MRDEPAEKSKEAFSAIRSPPFHNSPDNHFQFAGAGGVSNITGPAVGHGDRFL